MIVVGGADIVSQTSSKKSNTPKQFRSGDVAVVVLVLILFVGSISIFYLANVTKPDLNADVPLVNSERYDVRNGSRRVFWMSNVVNATSIHPVQVAFWVNTSEYNHTSYVCFKYFNGTHSEYYNASELTESRDWYYYQWWTGHEFVPTELFNTTIAQELGFEIPRQDGSTEVLYQLTVAVWNGTGLEFYDYSGTYVVRYSRYKVLHEQEVYVTTGMYWSIFVMSLVFAILPLAVLLRSTSESQPEGPDKATVKPHQPNKEFLVARSDHLDDFMGSLRTGASVLLGLGIGYLVWSGFALLPFFAGLTVGMLSLAIASFLAIVLSFSSTRRRSNGHELDHSLLPQGQSIDEYKRSLRKIVEKKSRVIGRMEAVIGTGLMYLATLTLTGMILWFLPSYEILVDRPEAMLAVNLTNFLVVIDSLLWSIMVLGSRGLEIFDYMELFRRQE